MTDPEWKMMTDWSGLPDVYVTKAECQQGMFWRIEACSVPMAIGPEVRLIRADRVTQQLADAQAAQALVVEKAAGIADAYSKGYAEGGRKQKGAMLARTLGMVSAADNIEAAIRALADPSGVEALAALRDEAEKWRSIASDNGRAAMDNLAAIVALESERDALAAKLAAAEARVRALTEAMDAFACDCSGRCERMEWLPADNGICLSRKARTALTTPAEETNG